MQMSSNPSVVWPDLPNVHAQLLMGAVGMITSTILPNLQSTYGDLCGMVANALAAVDPNKPPVRRLGMVLQQLAGSAMGGQINNQAYIQTLHQFVANELQTAQSVRAQQAAGMQMQPGMMGMQQPYQPFPTMGITTQYGQALQQATMQPHAQAIQPTIIQDPMDLHPQSTALPAPVAVPDEKPTVIEVPKKEHHTVTSVAIAVKQLPHSNDHTVFRFSEQMVAARSNGTDIRLLTASTLRGFSSPLEVASVLTDHLSRADDGLIHKAMPTAANTPWAILVSYPQLLWSPIPTAQFLRLGQDIQRLASSDTSTRCSSVTSYMQELKQGDYNLMHAELMRQCNYFVRRHLHLGAFDLTVDSLSDMMGIQFSDEPALKPVAEHYQFQTVWYDRVFKRVFDSLVRRPLSISTDEDRSDTIWSIVCDKDDTVEGDFRTDPGVDDLCRHPQNMVSLNDIGVPGADAILFAKDNAYRQQMISHMQSRGTVLRRPSRTLITNVVEPLALMGALMQSETVRCDVGEIRTMMDAIGVHRGGMSAYDLDSVVATASYPGRKMWSHDIVQVAEYLPGLKHDTNFGRFARWNNASY